MAAGCATARGSRLIENRTFRIRGVEYLPLTAWASLHEMRLDWDAETQKVELEKEALRLRFRVGSSVVIVNGETQTFSHPVLLHKGVAAVPLSSTKVLSKYLVPEGPASLGVPPRHLHTVVVDAGHGGEDTGAVGRLGLKEKHVTLDIARRLKHELEGRGLQVVMTREEDEFVSLYQRTYFANRAEGDFFVSVHCNASLNRDVDGFELYYFTPLEDSAALISPVEASSDTVPQLSMELARAILGAMENRLPLPNRGVKAARFFVLKEAKMPAVLVEVGYISNRAQETSLEEKSYRQDLAEAIAEGIWVYTDAFERTDGFTDSSL